MIPLYKGQNMLTMAEAAKVVFVGAGATAVMDVWGMAQRTLGMPTLDFAMVGRWAGHLVRGRFMHNVIGKSAPIAGERALGWTIHYLVGIAFAALLIALYGLDWLQAPRLMPALIVGVATVAFPFSSCSQPWASAWPLPAHPPPGRTACAACWVMRCSG